MKPDQGAVDAWSGGLHALAAGISLHPAGRCQASCHVNSCCQWHILGACRRWRYPTTAPRSEAGSTRQTWLVVDVACDLVDRTRISTAFHRLPSFLRSSARNSTVNRQQPHRLAINRLARPNLPAAGAPPLRGVRFDHAHDLAPWYHSLHFRKEQLSLRHWLIIQSFLSAIVPRGTIAGALICRSTTSSITSSADVNGFQCWPLLLPAALHSWPQTSIKRVRVIRKTCKKLDAQT